GPRETVSILEEVAELLLRLRVRRVLGMELAGALEKRRVIRVQLIDQPVRQARRGYLSLLAAEPVDDDHLACLHVARAGLHAKRHAAYLPVRVLVTGAGVAPVDAVTHPSLQRCSDGRQEPADRLPARLVAEDRNDSGLHRCDARWHDEPAVVAVRHHQASDQPPGDAPGRRVAELPPALATGEAEVVGAAEVLAEVVR